MKQVLIYLASPYSHPDEKVREERFKKAAKVTGLLMCQGLLVFSPIVHSHPIALENKLPTHFDFWQKYDYAILTCCCSIYVLQIPGWESSIGILREVEMAKTLGLKVRYVNEQGVISDTPHQE